MTQIFDEAENLVPITVLEVGPCPIVEVKEASDVGYSAVRVGYGPTSESRLTKAEAGVFQKAGTEPYRLIREFRLEDVDPFEVGQVLDAGMFEAGELVMVTGQSKGKGFQGSVRRHHFKGGPKTHGQSDRHRAPGSIGQSSFPARVFKGMRMAGHMGDRRVTVRGLRVVRVDTDRNLIMVKGAVPGSKGGIVVIRKQGA